MSAECCFVASTDTLRGFSGMAPGFIPKHGGYEKLLSYQKAEVLYDITFRFCSRFLSKGDRTIDQMVQAARSGKQNIIEGGRASGTSKQTEVFLLGVARGSFDELLADYKDFLRVRDLPLWEKNSKEAAYVRKISQVSPLTFEVFRGFCETRSADVVANIAVCLIHQANYLLDQQIRRLERDFVHEGDLRERMKNARKELKEKPKKAD